MANERMDLKSLKLQHVLYMIASLPFVLFAVLWLLGFFKGTPLDSRPAPSPTPIPSPAPSVTTQSATIIHAKSERVDTARQHPPGKNAADFYKQAWGLYNQLDLSDAEKKMLGDRSGKWDAEKARALFEKIKPVMDLLRQAKDAAYADWGVELKDVNSPVPQVPIAWALGRLLAWNSAYEFQTDPKQALGDLSLNAGLASSMINGALIGFMGEQAIYLTTGDVIRQNAAELTPDLLDQATSLLRGNNLWKDLGTSLSFEPIAMDSMVQKLKNPSTQDQALAMLLGGTANVSGASLNEARQYIPDYIALVNWTSQTYQELPQKILLSDADFQSWLNTSAQNIHSALVNAQTAVLSNIRNRFIYESLQNSMLQTGLWVLKNGSGSAQNFSDMLTGQPFTFVPTAAGFELQSTFQYKGKPVSMQFPTPKP